MPTLKIGVDGKIIIDEERCVLSEQTEMQIHFGRGEGAETGRERE